MNITSQSFKMQQNTFNIQAKSRQDQVKFYQILPRQSSISIHREYLQVYIQGLITFGKNKDTQSSKNKLEINKQNRQYVPYLPYPLPNSYISQSLMLLLLLISTILLLVVWIAETFYFKPQREMRRYKVLFEQMGYSACLRAFKFLGVGLIAQEKQSENKYKDCLYHEKYIYNKYDIHISNALNKVWITFVSPQLIKDYFAAQAQYKFPKLQLLIRGLRQVAGSGVPLAQGYEWKNKRKIISKAFTYQLLIENIHKIVEITNNCLDQYDIKYKIGDKESRCNMVNLSTKIFNRVMLQCFFGCNQLNTSINDKSFDEFIVDVVNSAIEVSSSALIILFGKLPYEYGVTKKIRKVKEAIQVYRTISAQTIQRRTKQISQQEKVGKSSDIIQSLIYQKMEAEKKGETIEYSDKDLIDEFTTFMIAGTETTSRLFTMMVYYISRNPSVQRNLREIISQLIKKDEDITNQNLKKLVYIDWIQNETLRFYGPAPGVFPRITLEDCYVGKIPIAKGTILRYLSVGNHFNDEYFKDPSSFRPERWQNECEKNHPYAFVGFSGGARNCLGKHLALLQSKIALIKFFQRYEKIAIPEKEVMLRMKMVCEPSPFEAQLTKR